MVMSWDGFWKMIWEEREWVFSGIGITVLTTVWVIVKSVWKKKPVDKTGTHEKIKKIAKILFQEAKTLLVTIIILRTMIIVMLIL